jgi:hypothetical protein
VIEDAVAFLRRLEPEGPWALTAIQPDRRRIETRTFRPPTIDDMRHWIEERDGSQNLYFHVNPPLRDITKKAERQDIAEVRLLHVDIDPRAGADLEAERARALGLLTERLPKGVPPPTIIIDSGGGYQGFWRLDKPIPIDGDLDRAEDAKRYNQQLELLFGADNCHNIDRVMRLPGTMNIPDARKIKKGRQPARATLHEFVDDRIYPLARFTPAPAGEPRAMPTVRVSGSIERLGSVDELDQWNVPDRVKIIIVQGRHPDEPKQGDDSRSAWVFDACCQLVRHEVPDDVIFSILTDRGFGISESVIEKGSNAEKYARRQIERAREEAVDPWLRQLNDRHFVIENDGGRCRVAELVRASNGDREVLSLQSVADFKHRYMNQLVQVDVNQRGRPIKAELGLAWLRHPQRRQYRGVVFEPGGADSINGCLNLWRGFGVEPRPGDWSLMKAHIQEVLASGDEASATYITRWAAWAVQNPDRPAEVALVLRGGQGTGKSTFGRAMARLFGQHGMQVAAPAQFAGRFNAHLRDVCLLFADEAVQPDDRVARGILKALLTEPALPIEGKGRDIVQVPNYTKIIMASNEAWVVPTDIDDRRFAVFEVSDARRKDRLYFDRLNKELDGGGPAAMLHDLLALPLDGWHPRDNIPETAARGEQKAASLTGFAAIFLDMLRVGEVPSNRERAAGRPFVATSEMREHAARRSRRGDITYNQVSELFKQLGFEKDDRGRPRGFVLPTLPEARAAWDRKMTPVRWDETTEWSTIEPPTGAF